MFITAIFVIILILYLIHVFLYLKKSIKHPSKANWFYIESIPGIFTTVGILGTFIGILMALLDFDVNHISASIPHLLEGLKTAFITSILGIVFSLISARANEYVLKSVNSTANSNDEAGLLRQLLEKFSQFHTEQNQLGSQLLKGLVGDTDDSIATQLVKLRTSVHDEMNRQQEFLENIHKSLGSDSETSLLTQLSRMRVEQKDYARAMAEHLNAIRDVVIESREYMGQKFEKFGQLLEKSNTEALVKAIENVIGGFNERLNELLERLVKENFEELNESVRRLNEWQQKNKEQVEALIQQFEQVSQELGITADTLKNVADYTQELVDGEGKLRQLITELEEVLVKNTTLRESTEHLLQSAEKMDKSAVTLQNWMELEKDFGETIEKLIESLREIEQLRDKSGEFWSDIRKHMEEGVSILEKGNKELLAKVNTLDEAFYERLNTSFRNLDSVLQTMLVEYYDRLKKVIQQN